MNSQWHYTWFVIESTSKALVGFDVSTTRGTLPALRVIHQAFGDLKKHPDHRAMLVADGNPAYDSATLAFNSEFDDRKEHLIRKKVVGLQNVDEESKEYRAFKNLVERLNRTYKFHTRPRSGFKSIKGAWALTILFVVFYNFMRPHSGMEGSTPLQCDALQGLDKWQEQWAVILQSAA